MAWEDLWRDLQLHLDDDTFAEFAVLFEGRSVGPTLISSDWWLLYYLDEAAHAWGDEGLKANPPDPAVAERHALIFEGAVVFKGSRDEAVAFVRGALAGRIQPRTGNA